MISRSRILAVSIFAATIAGTAPMVLAADEPGRITVTGEGSVAAVPDMAVISFGVLKSAPSAREALDAANTALADTIKGFKDKGVEARDIQTSGFSVSPQFDHSNKNGAPPKVVGYQVSNTLTVRIRDIGALGKILDDAISDGINSGGSLTFGNSKAKELVAAARKAAVTDAIAKATSLTEAAGVATGDIISINEEPPAPPQGPVLRMAMAKEADSVPVEAGENDYHARVTVTFAIRQHP